MMKRFWLPIVFPLLVLYSTLSAYPVEAQTAPPPIPLPHDCNGFTPPGGEPPTCCAFGYVYHIGEPVNGANVLIESLYGSLYVTTTLGGDSDQPYYSVNLDESPLLVSPGDLLTVTAVYAGHSNTTVYRVAPGGQQVDVVLIANRLPPFGNGSDGDLIVSTGETVQINTTKISVSASGTSATPNSSTGFAVGDAVLFHQTQGTANAGCWEMNTIAAINSTTSWELTYPLGCAYDNTNGRAQVVKVPQYQNVTIHNGGTLSMPDWDGNTGGILSFYASGTVSISGHIDADGNSGGSGTNDRNYGATGGGFRGGNNSTDGSAAEWGESYDGTYGYAQEGSAANYSGGGGASGGNKCGGGGGNGSAGISGWPNDGSGGYGLSGGTSGTPDLSRMVFGGGGGGGKGNNNKAGGGGSGGGIVFLSVNKLNTTNGTITAQGGGGGGQVIIPTEPTAGGAGAGGSIFIRAEEATLGTEHILATGGGVNGATEGRGGTGRIRIEYGVLSGSTNPSASTQKRNFNSAPIATINTLYPNPAITGQDTITFKGVAVDNDENGSSVTLYLWRSNRDGILSNQASFTRTAASLTTGDHVIYFRAKDDEGNWSDEISTTLTIKAPGGNAPTAAFTLTPTGGTTATVFHFDASECNDVEDASSALAVRWDWDDDGSYDTGWSNAKTITHTYASTGTYTVRLEVRDTDGMTDTESHTLSVSPAITHTPWLFMLYLDGDNNLYPWMEPALRRLEAMAQNPNLIIVALLDGPGSGGTYRYHVQPGGNYTAGINRWAMGELNMGAPQTLSDFVTWARSTYPAEHTYLAVTDHGRGTTGIAWDDTSGNNAFITVAELRTALDAATESGASPLDVVHYDACLMGMFEDSYQIKDFASYLIASQNLGWSTFAYDQYVAHVTPTLTPAQLATAIVNDYDQSLGDYPHTISAVNLGQANAVKNAVSEMASALRASLSANKYYVRNTRDSTQKFDSQDYYRIDNNDEYIDLYDFARLTKQNNPDTIVKSKAQAVMDAIPSFVIAERHQSGYYGGYPYWDLDDAHGTSIYFPPAPSGWGYNDYMAHVFRFTAESEWDEFLQAYFGLMGTPPGEETDPGLPPLLAQAANISKSVEPTGTVQYGDQLTYTIVLSAASETQLHLYDPLSKTTFIRFVTSPSGITHQTGAITGTVTITPSDHITVTFTVQIGTSGTTDQPAHVSNRACVYPAGGTVNDCTWSNTVTNAIQRAYGVYLPLVIRGR